MSATASAPTPEVEVRPGMMDRFLGGIERVGNKVPHPAIMFLALCIGVIVLSQLNRSVEQRGESSRPRMADIREAGEIEQDADWIQFLWSKIPLDEQKDAQNPEIVVSVAKNRNGPTGDVQLRFRKDCGRFECMTLDGCEEEERPRHKN